MLSDEKMSVLIRSYNAAMSQPSQFTECGGIFLRSNTVIRKITTHHSNSFIVTIDKTNFIVASGSWSAEIEIINNNSSQCFLSYQSKILNNNSSQFFLSYQSKILLVPELTEHFKLTLFHGDYIQFSKDLVLLKMFLPET
jgi:hypothetical protein